MLTLREIRPSSSICARLLRRSLAAIIVIAGLQALMSVASAQQPVRDLPIESDIATLIQAEAELKLLHSGQFVPDVSNLPHRVERRLNGILERDPQTVFRFQIKEDLRAVGEILAQHDLVIATLYLERARQSKGGLKGAQGRLLGIAQKYPHYSKMDEVLLLLAEVSMLEERPGDAAAYLRKLIFDHPSSSRVGSAIEQFNEIPLTASESGDEPGPQ